ncbi:MAG: hypothetical protein LBI14_08575, partial [Treponema sp.]|nr:hypothetical protein [Treponema sp.]
MNNLLKKKAFFGFTILAVLLIPVGCNGNGSASSGTVLDSDFFDQRIRGEITVSAYDSIFYKT